MKKLFINLTLAILATILIFIFLPISLIFSLIKYWVKSKKGVKNTIADMLFQYAKGIDQTGNATCYVFLNATLIKNDSIHPFGNVDETISSVLGVNKLENNLTTSGKVLDKILDIIDPNHSIKSIGQ